MPASMSKARWTLCRFSRHVAEHCDAAAAARQVAQGLQGREHRISIGVVRIVEHANAVGLTQLQPHFWRRAFGEAAFDFGTAQTEFSPDSKSEKCVHNLMV